MNVVKKYNKFKLIGYDRYFYIFEEGNFFDAKNNIIMIREVRNTQTEANISENINQPSGLFNYGHSCYINAFLQCLINCVPLTNYFLTKYHKTNYNCLSNIYQDFIKKYQQKDFNAAQDIINYFLSFDSSIKNTGSDSGMFCLNFLIKFKVNLSSQIYQ